MLFSIYTPTHKPSFLLAVYDSLCSQSFSDWEWLILPNGGLSKSDIPSFPGPYSSRVRILEPLADSAPGVGKLKQYLCVQAQGQFLVELDHDDLLAPQALRVLSRYTARHPQAFFYSDFCAFDTRSGTDFAYDSCWGWQHYTAVIGSTTRLCHRAFAPSARSLAEIWCAPNHIRVWSRAAYLASGGYDPTLPVADDYDLLCRTYLAGIDFVHVPEPLYIYCLHGENTSVDPERNALIQQLHWSKGSQYLRPLILEWCRREALPAVSWQLVSGLPFAPYPGTLHIGPDGEIQADFTQAGLPLPDDSAGAIFLDEQVFCLDRTDFVALVHECYRVLVPGGWLCWTIPDVTSPGFTANPTYKDSFSYGRLLALTDRRLLSKIPGLNCRFQSVRLQKVYVDGFPEDWLNLEADLWCLKGQPVIGAVWV